MTRAGAGAIKVGLAVAALAVLAAAGCRSPSARQPPHILLITIDTLRADHLGVYGYPRPTSPNIDAFARDAVVFSHGIAQAPYTRPSLASLFTGLFPTAHKAVSMMTPEREEEGVRYYTDVLGPEVRVLPEVLRAAGYRTLGFSAHPRLTASLGYDRGFDRFESLDRELASAHAVELLPRVLAALDEKSSKPFFIWIHLVEPHTPYDPPEPYRSMFPPPLPPRPLPAGALRELEGGPNDFNTLVARYDGEIRAADAAIGTLFGELRRRGLWDDTAIVLTADHGEEFLEHGSLGHGRKLFDEQLHVPFIVKAPSLEPRRITGQAQLVDVLPTLAKMAGAQVPERLHGIDLTPVLQGRAQPEPYAYAELTTSPFTGDRQNLIAQYALRTLEWKYISTLTGTKQLFLLTADPGERVNLVGTRPQEEARFEQVLAGMVADAVKAGEGVTARPVPIDPALVERLRALGYAK